MKTIAARQLTSYLKQHPQAQLIDLRSSHAYAASHVRGALNIPYEDGLIREDLLNRGRELVFYCQRGGSAMAAARDLGGKGWDTTAVIGGYEDISRLTEIVSAYKI